MPGKRKTIRIDGVFDIECYSWDKFKLGVTMTANGDVKVHRTAVSMVETMYGRGGSWWGHNGGKYDILQVLEILRTGTDGNGDPIGQSISLSQSRVTRSMGGGLMMRDSYALVPMGLEYLAEMGGRITPRLWFDCKCANDCGGYCMIARKMSYLHERRLEEYCIQDCEALYHGLDALRRFADENDYDLLGTIGGSSWQTARRVLGLPDCDLQPSVWRRLRGSYYGGRCSVFRPVVKVSGNHWDIGSAYPAALARTEVPIGEHRELGHRAAQRSMGDQRPGIYSCTITVPESNVPPLPWGWGEGIAFPIGVVSGTWALPEIQNAITHGCSVESVEWGIVWDKTSAVFGDWIRDIYNLRRECGKDSAFGKWLRLFPNSLIGKMAERPDKRMLRMNPPVEEIVICRRRKRCAAGCICGEWEQIDKWGQMWSVPFFRPSESSHVHWASYITATSRIAHSEQVIAHGDDAVYCDTDSLWTTSDATPVHCGDGLGEWSLKCRFSEWEGPAPKSYAYTDGNTGERVVSSAGSFVKPSEWTKGDVIQDRGVLSILDAARAGDGLFRRAHRKWTVPKHGEWYGDRRINASGHTVPSTIPQLRIRLDERIRDKRTRRENSDKASK